MNLTELIENLTVSNDDWIGLKILQSIKYGTTPPTWWMKPVVSNRCTPHSLPLPTQGESQLILIKTGGRHVPTLELFTTFYYHWLFHSIRCKNARLLFQQPLTQIASGALFSITRLFLASQILQHNIHIAAIEQFLHQGVFLPQSAFHRTTHLSMFSSTIIRSHQSDRNQKNLRKMCSTSSTSHMRTGQDVINLM